MTRKGGRPPRSVDLALVMQLRAGGSTWPEIAKAVGVHINTLKAHLTRNDPGWRGPGVRRSASSMSLEGKRRRERARKLGRLGRKRKLKDLGEADRLRATGQTWVEIGRRLGVSAQTLRRSRVRGDTLRGQLPHQRKLLVAASRFLRANLGEGLTPVEFKDAKALVGFVRALYRENGELRVNVTKARQRIRDLERMLSV